MPAARTHLGLDGVQPRRLFPGKGDWRITVASGLASLAEEGSSRSAVRCFWCF